MRKEWKWFAVTLMAAVAVGCGVPANDSGPNSVAGDTAVPEAAQAVSPVTGKPNVIWILLDAARAKNFSCCGYDRATTPNLERLAARGVVFEENYSQAQATVPSVPSFLTGRYFPSSCVASRGWKSLFVEPPAGEVLIPRIMADNGYATKLISATHWIVPESRLWKDFSEQVHLQPEDPSTVYAQFEQINAHLFDWLNTREDTPFFVYMHTMNTHHPHFPKAPFDEWLPKDYESKQIDLARGEPTYPPGLAHFSEEDKEYLNAMYDTSIAYTDQQIGVLMDKLDELGLTDNTILIVSSDHGDTWGGDGRTWGHPDMAVDELMHVPLVMAGPGLPRGVRVQDFTENIDIVPTIIDVLNLTTDAKPDGQSLAAAWDDDPAPFRDHIFFHLSGVRLDQKPTMVIRNHEYKYKYDFETGEEHLWTVPDSIKDRNDVLDAHPDIASSMRQQLTDRYLPYFDRLASQPYRAPDMPFTELMPGHGTPNDAYVPEHIVDDNKWALTVGGLKCTWKENPPPVTIPFEVPNGEYNVELMLFASSKVAIQADTDTEPKLIVNEQDDQEYNFISIGTYTVTDGTFMATFDNVENERAFMLSLRFLPTGAMAPSAEEESKRDEQLRALGYL